MASPKTIGADKIEAAIRQLATAISGRHSGKVVLLGIANGGIELARRLGRQLGVPVGTLDISFHRDDFGAKPIPKEFAPTIIPIDVTNATVVLVDDVLFSGRTVKAALDELFDHGRPNKVELAVLVDRGGRKLPLATDYCGLTLEAAATEDVKVFLDEKNHSRDSIRVIVNSGKGQPTVANRKPKIENQKSL